MTDELVQEPQAPQEPEKNPNFRWYILHAYSGFERKVKESLESRIQAFGLESRFGRIMIPTEPVTETVNGKKRTIERVFLPGYVLIEMLAGQSPFAGLTGFRELLEAKRFLAQRLPHILPEEVVCNELLMTFCRGLIAPDPARRFPARICHGLVRGP